MPAQQKHGDRFSLAERRPRPRGRQAVLTRAHTRRPAPVTDVGSGRGVSPGPRAGPALLPSTFPAGHLQVMGFVATPACDRDCASSTTRGRLPAEEKPPRTPEDSRPSAVGVWLIGSCAAVRNPASEAVGSARKGGEKLQPQLSSCSGGRRRGFNEDGTGGGSPPDTAFSRGVPVPRRGRPGGRLIPSHLASGSTPGPG